MSSIAETVAAVIAALASADIEDLPDADRIDELTALEQLKAAAFARQVRVTDAFARSQRARLVAAGSKAAEASRSVCGQVGLARRDSPHKGNRHVGWPAPWSMKCPGCWRCCNEVGPVNGGPP